MTSGYSAPRKSRVSQNGYDGAQVSENASSKAALRIDGRVTLHEGDGLFISNATPGEALSIESIGADVPAEFVFFDMALP